jgi:hypothetical protein
MGRSRFVKILWRRGRQRCSFTWPRRNPQVAGVIFADDGIGDPEAE